MTDPVEARLGLELTPAVTEVTADAVKAYRDAIGDQNAAYAVVDGGAGQMAPPAFAAVYALAPPSRTDSTGIAPQRLVHGEQEFEWIRPARVGERLTTRTRVADVYRKRSLQFMVIEGTAVDEAGSAVCISRATILVLPEPTAT